MYIWSFRWAKICLLYIIVFVHVPGSQLPKSLECPERKEQWEYISLSYLVSCLQFLKMLQSHKGGTGILLVTTFPSQLVSVNE